MTTEPDFHLGPLGFGDLTAQIDSRRFIGTAATAAELTAFPTKHLRKLRCVAAIAGGALWMYDPDSVATAAASVLVPDDGTGRWIALRGYVSKTIGEADLTNTTPGGAQTLTVGALPSGARVTRTSVKVDEAFGVAAEFVSLEVGSAGVHDALIAGSYVHYDPPDEFYSCNSGDRTGVPFVGPVVATFTPDGSTALVDLTAGSLTIQCDYYLP